MDRSLELDDSKEDAARALFNPSHVTLFALAHGMSAPAVRRRLLAHIAGAPPPPRPTPPSPPADPYAAAVAATTSTATTATTTAPSALASAPTRLHRTRSGDHPIILAYIRQPRDTFSSSSPPTRTPSIPSKTATHHPSSSAKPG